MSVLQSILKKFWQLKRQDVRNLLSLHNILVLSIFVNSLINNSNSSLNKLRTIKKLTKESLRNYSVIAWFGQLEVQLRNNQEKKSIMSWETLSQSSLHRTQFMNITFQKRREIGRLGKRNFQQLIPQPKRIFSSIRFKFQRLILLEIDTSLTIFLRMITTKFLSLDTLESERQLLLKTSYLVLKVQLLTSTSIFQLKPQLFKFKTSLKNSLKEEARTNGSQRTQRRRSSVSLMIWTCQEKINMVLNLH